MTPCFTNEHGQLYNCDVMDGLRGLPDNSVDLIVTSPPYWGLRDYGVDGQIGLETDFQTFLSKLVEIFIECHRVLKPTGNLYVNMGDSYSAGGGDRKPGQQGHNSCVGGTVDANAPKKRAKFNLPAKNLIGQPWRLAFALQDNGWILREDIIWAKGNPMPESVTDRCTRAHEYIFHFTKSPRYYYDAYSIAERSADATVLRLAQNIENQKGSKRTSKNNGNMKATGSAEFVNKKSVWRVSTKHFKCAHFATFPPDLIAPIIQAACPLGGTVLDIFGGSGTSAFVAEQFQRKWLLFELNPKYCDIAVKRIQGVAIEDSTPMLGGEKLITIEDFIEVQG